MIRLISLAFLQLIFYALAAQQSKRAAGIPIHDGEIWNDTDGKRINAHGAGILEHDGKYYMFGEIKKGITWQVPGQSWEDYRVPAGGVSCYSSRDLVNWKNEGVVLKPVTGDPVNELDTGKVIERPKVIYNRSTGKFIMWMHIDANDYSYSQAGVAVSDKPAGPYKYLGSVKPNGQMARDMTLFKDDDERAYLIYASEKNKTMQVCLLSDDYLSPSATYTRITSATDREAPAVFKFNKKYYLLTSDCTGWSPNPATYAVSDSLLGEWKQSGNPCNGPGAESTFQSQSTFVLRSPRNKDAFIFMADRWNKSNLEDSRYIWLPLIMKDGSPKITWVEKNHLQKKSPGNIPSKLAFTATIKNRVFLNTNYYYKLSAFYSAKKRFSFSVPVLPSWLQYDSVTRSISGKAVKAGQFPVHITIANRDTTVHRYFMLTVYNNNTTNILCLGNSITNGTDKYNSYRRDLWKLLHQNNYNFDMIGSWSSHHIGGEVPDPDFDMDHDGHSGWTAADVLNPPDWDKQRGNIHQWLQNYSPGMVLMELGTNEVFQCVPVDNAIKNIGAIIDSLRKRNSAVMIFLAQIPPLGRQWAPKKLCGNGTAYAQRVTEFNEAVKSFAVEKNSAASRVIVVDQYTGVDPSKNMYDDIHPNDSGEKIMAEKWFNAIRGYLKKL